MAGSDIVASVDHVDAVGLREEFSSGQIDMFTNAGTVATEGWIATGNGKVVHMATSKNDLAVDVGTTETAFVGGSFEAQNSKDLVDGNGP